MSSNVVNNHSMDNGSSNAIKIFELLEAKCNKINNGRKFSKEQIDSIFRTKKFMCGLEQTRSYTIPQISPLEKVLAKYFIFNEKIENKSWKKEQRLACLCNILDAPHSIFKDVPCVDLNRVEPLALKNLCHVSSDLTKLNLEDSVLECSGEHAEGSSEERYCPNLCLLLTFTARLTLYLRSKSKLKFLWPTVSLIGSLYEQTRIGIADELDCNIIFEAFEKVKAFSGMDSGFHLILSDEGVNLLQLGVSLGHLVLDDNVFDYIGFLELILDELREGMKTIKGDSVFDDFEIDKVGTNCLNCRKTNINDPEAIFKHCQDCLPAVCITKRGPCLLIKNTKLGFTNSIDICPIFSFENKAIRGPLGAMYVINQTLISTAPAEALPYLIKLISNADLILPQQWPDNHEGPVSLGIKLFSYTDSNHHFILRPGQVLHSFAQFEEFPQLKAVYIYLKALKDIFDLDIKSFLIKKVCLKSETKALTKELVTKNPTFELLHKVLNLNDLKPMFEKVIDYAKYELLFNGENDDAQHFIPLKWPDGVEKYKEQTWDEVSFSQLSTKKDFNA